VIEPFARRDFGRLAMLKRLFGIVVLVAIVAAVYVWKVRPAEGPAADASAREPGDLARGLGEPASLLDRRDHGRWDRDPAGAG
jgi:hypothetical protein